jgi:hypothetical protein
LTNEMATLLAYEVIGRVVPAHGQMVLPDNETTLLVQICVLTDRVWTSLDTDINIDIDVDMDSRRFLPDPMLCLSAKTADGDKVMILVEMVTPASGALRIRGILTLEQFEAASNCGHIMMGSAWLLFHRDQGTFRICPNVTHQMCSVFKRVHEYSQVLWLMSELCTIDIHVVALMEREGCYVDANLVGHADAATKHDMAPPARTLGSMVWVAPPPAELTIHLHGAVCQVTLSPKSEWVGQDSFPDHTSRCVGQLQCARFSAPLK